MTTEGLALAIRCDVVSRIQAGEVDATFVEVAQRLQRMPVGPETEVYVTLNLTLRPRGVA